MASVTSNFAKLLECSVCYLRYDTDKHRPRTLTCGHSFCSSCLEMLIKSGQILCAMCGSKHGIKVTKIDDIKISYTLLDIITALKGKKTTPAPPAVCQAHVAPSHKICCTHNVNVCERCIAPGSSWHPQDKCSITARVPTKLNVRSVEVLQLEKQKEEQMVTSLQQLSDKCVADAEKDIDLAMVKETAQLTMLEELHNSLHETRQNKRKMEDILDQVLEQSKKVKQLRLEVKEVTSIATLETFKNMRIKLDKEIQMNWIKQLLPKLSPTFLYQLTTNLNEKENIFATLKIGDISHYAGISVEENLLICHALTKKMPENVCHMLPYENVLSVMNKPGGTGFLQLSWNKNDNEPECVSKVRGIIHIKTFIESLRGRQFITLCTGMKCGVSYLGSTFSTHAVRRDGGGIEIQGGLKSNPRDYAPLQDPEIEKENLRHPMLTRGLVRGTVAKGVTGGMGFYIAVVGQRDENAGGFKDVTRTFGNVTVGMELLEEIMKERSMAKTVISDCGLVFLI